MILKSDIIIPLNISCRGGFCSNPCKLIVLFGEPSPQGFGFQATWEVRIFTLWAWHLSPTSARNAPHSWFISPWSYHECTTTTQGLINHEWSASPTDVGLGCHRVKAPQKSQTPHSGPRTKPCGLGFPKWTNC